MTIISLDISTDFEAQRPPNRPQPPGFRGILVSLLIHGALIGLVVVLSQKHRIEEQPQHPAPIIIDATLLIPPVATAPEPEAEPVVEVEIETVVEPPTSEDSSELMPVPELAEIREAEASEIPPQETVEDTAAGTEQPTEITTTTDNGNTIQPPVNSSIDFTRRYFEQSARNIAQEEAVRASREFETQKNSPTLYDSRTEDTEQQESRPQIAVNCESTTNKTLSFFSALAGGTLRCSDRGDAKQFIDARINKKPISLTPQRDRDEN